jgi:drug/metabolite transporter (DMT)-like permease
MPSPAQAPARGRLLIVLAALLWSTSGAFTKVLTNPTRLELHEPRLDVLQIAALRVLFGGLVLLPLLRPRDISFTPALALTALSFAVMNATFVAALALGKAANAILLQYTAPLWLYLVCVGLLGEPATRRATISLGLGLLGVGLLIFGEWEGGELPVVMLGLASGVFFAGVVLGLGAQRNASAVWTTAVNHLFGGLVLLPLIWSKGVPTLPQLGWLFAFGALQMSVPYMLMARGMRSVGPQEAGTLTLLEPLLNPLWAYLVSPETEAPTRYTLYGGACVLGGLLYRYWPTRAPRPAPGHLSQEAIHDGDVTDPARDG